MHFFGQNVDMWDLYRREGDKMEIWNVKLNDIIYKFYDKKKFMGMASSIGSKDDYDILEVFCREKFGEPTEETKSRLEWWGKKLG